MTANVIALDAMGGDRAPEIVVDGAALALERFPKAKFIFFGDEHRVKALLANHAALRAATEISHTSEVIAADLKPSLALRQGRNSSMRRAIDAVASGNASSVVSAGNTGALMATAKFVLKTLPGIDRPAIASVVPTKIGESVMLDLGANVECDAENLVQFALMGVIYCRAVHGISDPSFGLLNIGTEEMKGHDEIRAAAAILRERPIPGRFCGFVEGNDVPKGAVDVVVTDGFTGNVALKMLEGTAELIVHYFRETFAASLPAKLGYVLARGAMGKLKLRTDPRRYNGAMFLGLQGVCVKSHGGADALGFANAVGVAYNLIDHSFNQRIGEELARHYGASAAPVGDENFLAPSGSTSGSAA